MAVAAINPEILEPRPATYSTLSGPEVGSVALFGCMNKHGLNIQDIRVTEANSHLFLHNNITDETELNYCSSALIVSQLQAIHERQTDGEPINELRELAFFDMQGKFYDKAVLTDLKEVQVTKPNNLNPTRKHTAYFSIPNDNGKREVQAIPVGNIYFLGLSYSSLRDLNDSAELITDEELNSYNLSAPEL